MAYPPAYQDVLGYKGVDPVVDDLRVVITGTYDGTETTISVSSATFGDLPDPALYGEYDLTWYNETLYAGNPGADPQHENVRVTAIDAGNEEITVTRNSRLVRVGTTPHDSAGTHVMVGTIHQGHFRQLAAQRIRTPIEHGAVGDGVTNDTVAYQAFLDAMDGVAGDAGYIPPAPNGNYYAVAGNLTMDKAFITIRGDGVRSSIQHTGTGDLFTFGNGTTNRSNINLISLTIGSVNTSADGYLIYWKRCPRFSMINMTLSTQSTLGAVRTDDSWEISCLDVRIGSVKGVCWRLGNDTENATFISCNFAGQGSTVVGSKIFDFIVTGMTGFHWFGGTWQSVEIGMEFTAGGRGYNIQGLYTEDIDRVINQSAGSAIESINFDGCAFNDADQSHMSFLLVDALHVSGCTFRGTPSLGHCIDNPAAGSTLKGILLGNRVDDSLNSTLIGGTELEIAGREVSSILHQNAVNGAIVFGNMDDIGNLGQGDFMLRGYPFFGQYVTGGGSIPGTYDIELRFKIPDGTEYKLYAVEV